MRKYFKRIIGRKVDVGKKIARCAFSFDKRRLYYNKKNGQSSEPCKIHITQAQLKLIWNITMSNCQIYDLFLPYDSDKLKKNLFHYKRIIFYSQLNYF